MLKGPAGEPPKMTASDLEEALSGLPLVDALVPKHSSMSLCLLSPRRFLRRVKCNRLHVLSRVRQRGKVAGKF